MCGILVLRNGFIFGIAFLFIRKWLAEAKRKLREGKKKEKIEIDTSEFIDN